MSAASKRRHISLQAINNRTSLLSRAAMRLITFHYPRLLLQCLAPLRYTPHTAPAWDVETLSKVISLAKSDPIESRIATKPFHFEDNSSRIESVN